MAQNILVTIDESDNSLRAVNYVAKIIQPEDRVTLFSVLPSPTGACELEDPSLITLFDKNKAAFCAIEDRREETIKEFMKKAKKILIDSNARARNIKIKIIKQEINVAKDILKESQENKYDNIVMGRRGLSGIKEFFLGSVSQKVVQFAKDTAVTIVE